MIYDSKKIVGELITRRGEYRRKRRRTAAAVSAAAIATVLAAGLVLRFTLLRGEVPDGAPSPTAVARATVTPREDLIYDANGPSEGWYNAPLDGEPISTPSTVSVYTMSSGVKTLCNITDPEIIESMLGFISMLEKDPGTAPVTDDGKGSFTLTFTFGRRVFRLESLGGGSYSVNDRGCFRLAGDAEESFPKLVEASAGAARMSAESVLLSFGGEQIIAFTNLLDP